MNKTQLEELKKLGYSHYGREGYRIVNKEEYRDCTKYNPVIGMAVGELVIIIPYYITWCH